MCLISEEAGGREYRKKGEEKNRSDEPRFLYFLTRLTIK